MEKNSQLGKKIYQLLTACGAESELYKNLFLREVLNVAIGADELSTLKIYCEYEGQIDLAFETARRFIPLEIKLEARDSPARSFEFLQIAKNLTAEEIPARLYCLTPCAKSDSEIISIDFAAISNWLKNCLSQTQTELFRTVINSFIAEVEKIAENQSAFDAETRELYEFLMLEVFEALDARLDEKFCAKYKLTKIAPAYKKNIARYYESVCSATPEILFRYSGDNWKRRNYEIIFFAGLDDGATNCLCAGWYLSELKSKKPCAEVPAKIFVELKKLFRVKLPKDKNFALKKIVPASKQFNFTQKNSDVDALFDDKNFAKAINSIFSAVEDLASNINWEVKL